MFSLPQRYLLITLILVSRGKNQNMLYGVNGIIKHPKRDRFLNSTPHSLKQFGGKNIFHFLMKNGKFLNRLST